MSKIENNEFNFFSNQRQSKINSNKQINKGSVYCQKWKLNVMNVRKCSKRNNKLQRTEQDAI